jgi:leucyl/phenylalanyl-tRNA--protein transferase
LPEHQADGQDGTWITNDMIEAYCKLNELGIAKSIEVWQNEELVGGLYGIDLGRIFLWGKYVF